MKASQLPAHDRIKVCHQSDNYQTPSVLTTLHKSVNLVLV